MKLQIISDLHQEFGITDFNFSKADVIVLAGDVSVGTKGIDWIIKNAMGKPVIYVLGNHEYYKGSYPKTLNKIKEATKGSNIHVLENESIEIDGIIFHGATLCKNF
jgi:predicted phosphodiesterase